MTARLVVGITDEGLALDGVAQRLQIDPGSLRTALNGTRMLSVGRDWVEDPPVPAQTQLAEAVGLVADRREAIRALVDGGSGWAKVSVGVQTPRSVRLLVDRWQQRVLADARVGFAPTFYPGEAAARDDGVVADQATVDLLVVSESLTCEEVSRRVSLDPRTTATTARGWAVWRHGYAWTAEPPARVQLDAMIERVAARASVLRELAAEGAFSTIAIEGAQSDTMMSLWVSPDQARALADAAVSVDLTFHPVPGE